MALNARFAPVATATTAGATAADKVEALVGGLFDAIVAELASNATITPNMKNKFDLARAHCITEAASFQTALGL